MSLFDMIDMELLNEILHGTAEVSGFSMSVTDYETDETSPIINTSRFCQLVASSEIGGKHCAKYVGGKPDPDTPNEMIEYVCEAGLCHVCAPIVLEGRAIGYIRAGQAKVNPPDTEKIAAFAEKMGVDPDELIEAYRELPEIDMETLHRTMQLVQVSATALARYAQFGNERCRLSEMLHMEQSLCQTIFARLNDGIIVCDEQGYILDCNESAARIVGLTVSQTQGEKFSRFVADQLEYSTIVKRIDLGINANVTVGIVRDDGSILTADVSAAGFKINDQHRVIYVLRDISEQIKLTETTRMQAALLEHVEESVVATDIDGNIIYWGPGAEKLHGWSRNEMLGRKSQVFLSKNQKNASGVISKIIRDGSWTGEKTFLRKDGSEFIGDVRVSAVRDENGTIIGVVGIAHDITSRKNEENERRRKIAELTHLYEHMANTDKARKKFIANVSHELRTPLSTLGVYVDMLLTGSLGEITTEQKRAADVMLRNVERLDELITEMFDSVRMDIGQLVIHHENVEIGEIVGRCIEYMKPLAKAAMLSIDYNASAEPVIVNGDENRLTQVFTNLIGNAIKYNRAEGKITVSVKDHRRGVVVVTVADTGIGIPPEHQSRIFEQFYQVTKLGGQSYGGTGLGLTLARQIVELHAGHISCESQPGQGSVFRVILPTVSMSVAPAATQADHEQIPSADRIVPPKLVLVVEDNEELLDMLRVGFKSRGFDVNGAHTGADGVRSAREHRPDVIVLDLALPDTDGIEVCKDLNADERLRDVPVIGITAWSNEDDLDRFVRAGACKIVRKPFVFTELLHEVIGLAGVELKTGN
ncbi:MAG: PAS domain S-box protein [Candidatus Hydrogenedentes bacterium]|nr:PAS domain S-box protein [Candidatus Hydrogenedentota bacterium]